jgi:hypothetical protein
MNEARIACYKVLLIDSVTMMILLQKLIVNVLINKFPLNLLKPSGNFTYDQV